MKVANLCISHKYTSIIENNDFFHIQVGATGRADLGIHRDDTGQEISYKNSMYCELTGLYWFWKNEAQDFDVVVLNHYRRLFLNEQGIYLSHKEISDLLLQHDAFVPYPKYYPVSISQQYEIMHYEKDWAVLKTVLSEKYPEYDYHKIWDQSNKGFLYNMFGLKVSDFNRMMTFLFDVLFEVEKRVDISDYSVQQQRIFGFMAERLTSLFIQENFSNIAYLPIEFEDGNGEKKVFNHEAKVNNLVFHLQKPFGKQTNKVLSRFLTSRSK